MSKNSKQLLISMLAAAGGFVLIFVLSNFLEKSRPNLSETYVDEDLTLQGAKLKGFSFGFEGLIADWYWMQSLQYVGDKVLKTEGRVDLENLKPLNPRLLYPLIDNATDLDPQFSAAYSYGAVVLPAIDPEQAIKITEKGIANNPNEWRLYSQLGYIYWRLQDYEKAAETYEKASRIPDAPVYLQMMTAQMKSQGGSRETARTIYRQMFDQAQDDQTKETARLRLLQMDSLDEIDVIKAGLQNLQTQTGKCAGSWRELFPLIQKSRLPNGSDLRFDAKTFAPVDPTDTPYILENQNGKCEVHIDFAQSKIPAQ